MVLSLALVGDGASRLFAFAAISVHGFSISLVFAPMLQHRPVPHRLAFGLALYICLLFGLYRPASIALQRCFVVLPVSGVARQPAIDNGDVLLYSGRWLRPRDWKRGDLVVSAIEPSVAAGVAIRGGLNVDRLIALPGDDVQMSPGVLVVNGQVVPTSRQPLGGIMALPPLDLTLADDDYLVFPSTFGWTGHGNWLPLTAGSASALGVVHEQNLLGKVMLRVRPWSRLGTPGSSQP
jgi:signal peptidase I